jgi:hypothetical protein
MVRESIDAGYPCYGWELEIPEFYLVYGYDDQGYYYRGPGCEGGKGPLPWQKLGDTGIGVLEMYSIRPGEAADDATVLKDAAAFALEHAANPAKWIFPGYASGLKAYDNWIAALERGGADEMGNAYNAGVWRECRHHAVGFLREARDRLVLPAASELEAATGAYEAVVSGLDELCQLYPWRWDLHDGVMAPVDDTSAKGIAALIKARAAEERGLQALERLVDAL